MNRSTWGAAALLIAVFAGGALAGGAALAMAERSGRWGTAPERGPEAYLRRLSHEVNLTSVQQDSVRAILARHKDQMDSVWREVRPRVETVRNIIRSEIRLQLAPDQRGRFDDMNRQHDEARAKMGR
jgi:hypothetical protein